MLLEDEQRYARDQIARQQQQQLRQFPYAQRTSAVAVPQQQGRGSSPQSPPSQRERDTMSDVQDQFTKLAESEAPSLLSSFLFDLREEVFRGYDGGRVVYGTLGRGRTHHTLRTVMILMLMHKTAGKRTFSSLVSKVKAKVQEFDQSRYADLHPPPPLFFCYITATATICLHLLLFFTPRTTPEEDKRGGSRRGVRSGNHRHFC